MAATKPTASRGEVARRWRQSQGDYIRELRGDKGMTQSDLVAALGTSAHQLVSHIETGRVNVPIERVEDFADILGVERVEFAKNLLRFQNPWFYAMIFGADRALQAELKAAATRLDVPKK